MGSEMNMTVLIDSSGWIEYFAEGPLYPRFAPFIEKITPLSAIAPAIVLYEVYKKLKMMLGGETALRAVAYVKLRTTVVPLEETIMLTAAENSIKFKLGMADALIFTIADEYGATIITCDRHFRGLPGVKLIE